jgi:TM2 domain-containing membrane protein YozV
MKKNGILTFLFAFVPGAGQMYQGYMKRGLSLITLFFLCIMAGMLLEPLVLTALIVWMYSFFDTFNLRAQFIAGTAPADDYLVHFNTKDARLTLFFRDSHKLLGWGLIALGGLVAYENVIMRVFGDVMWRWGQNNPVFRAFYLMLDELPQIVTCVALIVCGLWLVRGPKGKKVHRKKAEEPEDEDFREYTAAEADAPEAPEETADFAMPKLSALLGDPVTPEDPEEPEQPENAEGDDGRTE